MGLPNFQTAVDRWMGKTFGPDIAADTTERSHRFIEEAIELVQATGLSKEDVLMLVDYVYARPTGELHQEVGGVLVTLAALANAHFIGLEWCGDVELERCWTKIEVIRQKQATKPGNNSPLPE